MIDEFTGGLHSVTFPSFRDLSILVVIHDSITDTERMVIHSGHVQVICHKDLLGNPRIS